MLDSRCFHRWLDRHRHFGSHVKVSRRLYRRTFRRVIEIQVNRRFVSFFEKEVNAVVARRIIGTKVDNVRFGPVVATKVHVELYRFVHFRFEGQIDGLRRAGNACACKQFMISGDLLPHDHNLVPVSRFAAGERAVEACSGIDECVLVTPYEVDFAQLRHQSLVGRVCFEGAVDEICSLVIKAIRHVEVCFGQRIRLVEVDSRFTAERILKRAELACAAGGFFCRSSFRNRSLDRVVVHRTNTRVLFDDHDGLVIMNWGTQ